MIENPVILYVFISVLLMLIIALGFIWFLNFAQKKITLGKIKEQELSIQYQKELLINTIKTKEKERNRIAQELHDDVSSQLSIINLNLHALKRRIPQDEKTVEILNQISNSLKSSNERARSISHELMPLIFKKFGIHYALKELESGVNLSSGMRLLVENDHVIGIQDEFKLLHIYRIAQELVNNTIKYASAEHSKFAFSKESMMMITMTYTDDGVGYDTTKLQPGLGISNIETRVTLLDGSMEIISSPGKGFKATIKFPNHD